MICSSANCVIEANINTISQNDVSNSKQTLVSLSFKPNSQLIGIEKKCIQRI